MQDHAGHTVRCVCSIFSLRSIPWSGCVSNDTLEKEMKGMDRYWRWTGFTRVVFFTYDSFFSTPCLQDHLIYSVHVGVDMYIVDPLILFRNTLSVNNNIQTTCTWGNPTWWTWQLILLSVTNRDDPLRSRYLVCWERLIFGVSKGQVQLPVSGQRQSESCFLFSML